MDHASYLTSSVPAGSELQVAKLINDVVGRRKTWKKSKCNAQPVWPPALEAALIEGQLHFQIVILGLRTYVPVDSRETRMLGRFPMRNRYLSDYILRTTGEIRSPQQIGSRLQQLRYLPAGTEVRELLQHRVPRPPLHVHSKSNDQQCSLHELPGLPAYNSRSPSSWTSSETRAGGDLGPVVLADDDLKWPSRPCISVIIDILPPASVVPSPANLGAPISVQPSSLPQPFASHLPASDSVFVPSPQPRPLSAIDPAVTLSSPSCLQATSLFSVVSREGHVVHWGMSALDLVCPCPTQPPFTSSGQGDSLLYRTELVPTYWNEICNSQDPAQFIIFHDVVPCPELAASCSTGVSLGQPASIFSAVYEFRYPHLAPMDHLPQAQGVSQPQSQQVHAIPNIAIDDPCATASPSSSIGVPVTHSAYPTTPQQFASPQFDSIGHGLVSEARSLPAQHHLHSRLNQGGELELALGQAHNPPWLSS